MIILYMRFGSILCDLFKKTIRSNLMRFNLDRFFGSPNYKLLLSFIDNNIINIWQKNKLIQNITNEIVAKQINLN